MTHKFLEHAADVKFQAEANTLEICFVECAKALSETILGDVKIEERIIRDIIVEGKDNESLLYNFLEEFLVLLDSEEFLLSKIERIEIDKENFKLKATILGDKTQNYKFTNDVKAVTYNEMFVKQKNDKWTAQVVLDV